MFKVTISNRPAVCKECKAKIVDFEPRIDFEREDDVPAGQEGAGWRTRRMCLKCGIKRMELFLQETTEQYSRAINVWNLTSKRKGWNKRTKKVFEPTMTKCVECAEPAVELGKTGKKSLYLCPKGHFMEETRHA